MNTEKEICLRPHHALCILFFTPNGHSSPYSEIMYQLIDIVKGNPKRQISLSTTLDMICGYCPHNENGICSKADEVVASDHHILAFCDWNIGDRLAWEDLRRNLIVNILAKDRLERTCKGCRYLPQCEAIRRKQVQPT